MSNPMKKPLPFEVKSRLDEYLKYRFGHKPDSERAELHQKFVRRLKEGGKEAHDKFIKSVDVFLETNKEVITSAKKQTENAEYQARLKDTMQRNRTK